MDSSRRGVEGIKFCGMGLSGLAGKPPPSGGGGGGICCTEQICALQVTLWLCGAYKKIPKNLMSMES